MRNILNKKKGVFLANDTYANMFLNLVIQKYGCLPDSYEIVGFDNSPIANEAIIPITTIGQQIDVIARTAMDLLVKQMDNRKQSNPEPDWRQRTKDSACADSQGDNQLVHRLCDMYQPNFSCCVLIFPAAHTTP